MFRHPHGNFDVFDAMSGSNFNEILIGQVSITWLAFMQENEKAYTKNQLPTYYAINETMLKVGGQVLVYIFFVR